MRDWRLSFGGLSAAVAIVATTMALLAPMARANFDTPGQGVPTAVIDEARKGVGVVEHPGQALPLDLSFVDEQGQPVKLRQYFSGNKPVVLQLGYYGCPMLCGLISRGLVDSVKELSLTAGKDYELVFVSIDPSEKPQLAAAKKQAYLAEYGRQSENGWHFLTGKQESIEPLAQAVGFRYKWVEAASQYSHPAVLAICTPDGRISRYLYGVKFDPQTVRLSLVEASGGKIGNSIDQFVLTCFQYDGRTGKYALAAIGIMRAGGVVMMIVVGAVLVHLFRKEARQRAAQGDSAEKK